MLKIQKSLHWRNKVEQVYLPSKEAFLSLINKLSFNKIIKTKEKSAENPTVKLKKKAVFSDWFNSATYISEDIDLNLKWVYLKGKLYYIVGP